MPDLIQLLTVENTTSRKNKSVWEHLVFVLQVANKGYDKQVDILWQTGDGRWQVLPAEYLSGRSDGQEYWQAHLSLENDQPHLLINNGKRTKGARRPLRGYVRFAARLSCNGQEYWDNNDGDNYLSLPNSGIMLAHRIALQNLSLINVLDVGQRWISLKVAVNAWFAADRVTLHWTIDNWLTSRQSKCRKNKPRKHSHTEIWTARLKIGDAFKLQFAISASNSQHEVWDNNGGGNYVVAHEPLKVMILNLHCYQEDQQDRKLSLIAKVIDELAVDVVCFQEVAEHWNSGQGDWDSNAVNIINQRLKQSMWLYTDWSHLGFDKYREGVAILSRFPFLDTRSRYVSDSHEIFSIHSRKVVMARIQPPYFGNINIYSAHLSWIEDGFQQQFQRLRDWAAELRQSVADTTLLCGDFNVSAGSIGYRLVVASGGYEDQYLAANARGLFEKIYRVSEPHWWDYPRDDYRIDYIFKNHDSALSVISARVLFTESDYGQVSDHCGYLMTFEPK